MVRCIFLVALLGLGAPGFGVGQEFSLGASGGFSQHGLSGGGDPAPGYGFVGLETTFLGAGDTAFFLDIAFGMPMTKNLNPIPVSGTPMTWQFSLGPGFRIPLNEPMLWLTAPCGTINNLNVPNTGVSMVSWGIQWFNQIRWKLPQPAVGSPLELLVKQNSAWYFVLQNRTWLTPFAFASSGLPSGIMEKFSWGTGFSVMIAVDF